MLNVKLSQQCRNIETILQFLRIKQLNLPHKKQKVKSRKIEKELKDIYINDKINTVQYYVHVNLQRIWNGVYIFQKFKRKPNLCFYEIMNQVKFRWKKCSFPVNFGFSPLRNPRFGSVRPNISNYMSRSFVEFCLPAVLYVG